MLGKFFGRHKTIVEEIPGQPTRDPGKAWKPPDDGPIIPENWRAPRDPEIPIPPPEKEPPENPPKD